MSDLRTRPNDQSVEAFLNSVSDAKKREASYKIMELMEEVTQEEPKMWGDSIVGFGSYHYKYKSGREGDWFLTGFSPRKQNLTLYIMSGFQEYNEYLAQLGKFTTGKSCLYVKKIEDINLEVLKKLVKDSVDHMVESNN